jgi:hypothetical protein
VHLMDMLQRGGSVAVAVLVMTGDRQVQAGGYFIKLTNDITFCSNNTTALPVFPGLNK